MACQHILFKQFCHLNLCFSLMYCVVYCPCCKILFLFLSLLSYQSVSMLVEVTGELAQPVSSLAIPQSVCQGKGRLLSVAVFFHNHELSLEWYPKAQRSCMSNILELYTSLSSFYLLKNSLMSYSLFCVIFITVTACLEITFPQIISEHLF